MKTTRRGFLAGILGILCAPLMAAKFIHDANQRVLTLGTSFRTLGNLSTTEIINRLEKVDNAFVVSANDLTEGLRRCGIATKNAGVSFENLIAQIKTSQAATIFTT